MQIRPNDGRNVRLPVTIAGLSVTASYDTGTNMSCISCTCYAKLQDHPPLQSMHTLFVNCVTHHNLCPFSLVQCNVMLGSTQFCILYSM